MAVLDFKIKDGDKVRTQKVLKASATVIETGDLVTLSSGLAIKAVAASTAVGYCTKGAGNGETEIEVTIGNDFTLVGTANANFAVANKGVVCDIITVSNAQQIAPATAVTGVLRIGVGKNSGTVGSASKVEVKIEKPLF